MKLEAASAGSRISSTVVLARYAGQDLALLADADAKQLRAVDLAEERELWATDLAGTPSHLLLAQDGRLYVALSDRAQVAVYQAPAAADGPLTYLCTVSTAAEPVTLAETPDGSGVLVTSRWGRRVALLDTRKRRLDKRFEAKVGRDPFAVAVTPDGRYAYVSHVVGGQLSRVELPAAGADNSEPYKAKVVRRELRQLDGRMLGSDKVTVERLAGQSFALAMSEQGELRLPAVLVEPGDVRITVMSNGYGSSSRSHPAMEDTLFSVGNKSKKAPAHCVASGEACLLPRAAAYDQDTDQLFVACAGTDSVVSYDRDGRRLQRDPVGAGVNGVAFDRGARRWVAWSQYDQRLSSRVMQPATLGDRAESKLVTVALERRGNPSAEVELGRRLFHEAGTGRIAHDGRACASCHPSGRDDTLTWATPDGPRQTPVLMNRLTGTAPYGWNGRARELDEHLRRTLRRLGGSGLTAAERKALVAYINSLEPPHQRVTATDQLARGEELFNDPVTSCGGCHVGSSTTDSVTHDVGSSISSDALAKFDTPSLRHIGQSAPYFHDGRYPSLLAMLQDHQLKMGSVKQLSNDDRQALAAYLETL